MRDAIEQSLHLIRFNDNLPPYYRLWVTDRLNEGVIDDAHPMSQQVPLLKALAGEHTFLRDDSRNQIDGEKLLNSLLRTVQILE